MSQLIEISKLELEDVIKILSAPEEPHKHDYEELILGVEGSMEHFIDFKTATYQSPYISFVTKGKIHQVKPVVVDNQCIMWVLRFKSEFIPEITFLLYSYYHDHANIQMSQNSCFQRMVLLCEMMSDELHQPDPDFSIIKHLLSALFTMIESQRKKLKTENGNLQKNQDVTFKNFLKILEENFRRGEGVDFYAEKLFMSSRNLNLICQNILQLSVTEIIETRKLIEAKNLLTTTDKSIAEIGFELGFEDPSHFSKFFKTNVGKSLQDFKENIKS